MSTTAWSTVPSAMSLRLRPRGPDINTVHQEATPHVDFALRAVRDAGCLAGLALDPGTAACAAAAIEVARTSCSA